MICNKVKFNRPVKTIPVMARMKEKYGGDFAAYYCAACNAYHITSHTKSKTNFLKFKG